MAKRWIQKKSGVYYIYNVISKKGYIGSSKHIERRFKEHRRELNKGLHVNNLLQNSWNKYGSSSFEFKILAHCPEEYNYKLEQWFLSNSSLNSSFNICKEVILPPKLIFTTEIRYKMSLGSIKRANKPKERERLKELAVKNWEKPNHRVFMQEINRGENHPQSKINEKTATEIKKELFNTPDYIGKYKDLSIKYNVTIGTIKSIKYQKSWKFIKIEN